MARFLLHCLLFLGLSAGLTLVLHRASRSLAPVHTREELSVAQLARVADEVEVLAVGNSHGIAIDFAAMGVVGYHVWRAGNDFHDVDHQLRSLAPRLPSLRAVLVNVSYFSFHRDNAHSTLWDHDEVRRGSYATMPGWTWIPGDLGTFIHGRLSYVVRPDHWRVALTNLVRRVTDRPPAPPHDGFKIELNRYGLPIRLAWRKSRGRDSWSETPCERAAWHLELQRDMLVHAPEIPEENLTLMTRLTLDLRQQGVEAIFYTPPFFAGYTRCFDATTVAEMHDLMARLVETTGARYLDFSTDPDFQNRPELFKDSDHLNRVGAERFSRMRLAPLF